MESPLPGQRWTVSHELPQLPEWNEEVLSVSDFHRPACPSIPAAPDRSLPRSSF